MSKKVVIVESENDQYFIEALLAYLNMQEMIEVAKPICRIDDFECLSGLSAKAILEKLKIIKRRIRKDDITHLGIVLDSDKRPYLSAEENERLGFGIENRLALINRALRETDFVLQSELKQGIPEWTEARAAGVAVKLACYITNVDGYGDLETVMKAITVRASVHADCLESWRECTELQGKHINQKYFDKFWLQIYFRYDCCRVNESNADKNCTGEIAIKKPGTWNFKHPVLGDLRKFLALFSNSRQ